VEWEVDRKLEKLLREYAYGEQDKLMLVGIADAMRFARQWVAEGEDTSGSNEMLQDLMLHHGWAKTANLIMGLAASLGVALVRDDDSVERDVVLTRMEELYARVLDEWADMA
jgi:hypothetical protein